MQVISLSKDNFDQDNTFIVEFVNPRRTSRMTVSLQRDYKKEDDGIFWGLQRGSCLKAQYTAKDVQERERLNNSTPVRNGDIVEIEGQKYVTRVLGQFSDCAIFDPVNS
jgi:hypothetical protein